MDNSQFPLVSIVTPSYNQGKFIEDTILSVKNQDYPNIEHIIIDGGSTDNTLDILKKYESTYNMRWISEPDNGMYEAVNKGLKMAQGEIMAYLNSDDLYLPWTISTIVDYFQNNPEVSLVYGDMLVYKVSKKLVPIFYPPFKLRYIQRAGTIGQPTVFWRREVFDQIGGFDDTLQFVGDSDYWIRAGKKFTVKKINEFLAIERDHLETKRYTKQEVLAKELQTVRMRYCNLASIGSRVGYVWDRLRTFLWQRLYMVAFLWGYYGCKLKRNNDLLWSKILNMPEFRLTPVRSYDLLLGFFPFTNRIRPRWIVSDKFLKGVISCLKEKTQH